MRSGREIVRVVIAVAITCIVAASAANAAPDQQPPVQYWDLPTHSRIAYLKFNASGARRAYPIVFLHGGPGAYVVTLDPTTRVAVATEPGWLRCVRLRSGRAAGCRNRLADITGYTVSRHLADLEAIRRKIRANKLILIGSSWGATLAARYVAKFPERVDRVIFVGPGALHPAAWRDDRLRSCRGAVLGG